MRGSDELVLRSTVFAHLAGVHSRQKMEDFIGFGGFKPRKKGLERPARSVAGI